MSGLLFLGFVFSSFGFFVDVVFRFFFCEGDTDQIVTGHPHTHWFCWFLFSFFVPPHLLFRPFWPCVLLLGGFSRGAILGPARFWIFLVLVLRPLFLDARRQGCFRTSCAWSFFFLSVLFCGYTFLDGRVGRLTEVG